METEGEIHALKGSKYIPVEAERYYEIVGRWLRFEP
jgi:hypothetical protein